jgi:hypothetical protein
MKPRLTLAFSILNLTISLVAVAGLLNWAFQQGLVAGIIAILCASPAFVLVHALLNSQFDRTSLEKADTSEPHSSSIDAACTTKTKEDESN